MNRVLQARIEQGKNYYNMLADRPWPSRKDCYRVRDIQIWRMARIVTHECECSTPYKSSPVSRTLRTTFEDHKRRWPGGRHRIERVWRLSKEVSNVNGMEFHSLYMAQAVRDLVRLRASMWIMAEVNK